MSNSAPIPTGPTQEQLQAAKVQAKVNDQIVKARADMHPLMNRRARRAAAKRNGIFKHKGVWPGLMPNTQQPKVKGKKRAK